MTFSFTHKFNLVVAIIIGIAIPLSTALENMALGLVVLAVLVNRQLRQELAKTLTKPFTLFALASYALFLFASLWSSAPIADIKHMLIKMIILPVIPFALAFFSDKSSRKFAINAFLAANLLTLVLSIGSFLLKHPIFHGATYADPWGSNNWCPFRAHAYHCYFLGLSAMYLLDKLLRKELKTQALIICAYLIVILISVDILYLVSSRTGQIAYLIMFFLTLVLWQPKKGLIISILLGGIVLPIVIWSSPAIQNKLTQAKIDLVNSNEGKNQGNSIGLRLTFHKYAKQLIKERPLFGHGTGSYPSEYSRIAAHDPINQDGNPHSDYLWFGVELGYVGMVLFIWLLLSFAYGARQLRSSYRSFALIIPITYAIICSQNSFITDSVSGIAFIFFASFILSAKPAHRTRFSD